MADSKMPVRKKAKLVFIDDSLSCQNIQKAKPLRVSHCALLSTPAGALIIKTCKLLMLTKKLIVPKAVTVHKSLVFVLNTVPLGGRSKGAS